MLNDYGSLAPHSGQLFFNIVLFSVDKVIILQLILPLLSSIPLVEMHALQSLQARQGFPLR